MSLLRDIILNVRQKASLYSCARQEQDILLRRHPVGAPEGRSHERDPLDAGRAPRVYPGVSTSSTGSPRSRWSLAMTVFIIILIWIGYDKKAGRRYTGPARPSSVGVSALESKECQPTLTSPGAIFFSGSAYPLRKVPRTDTGVPGKK